MPSDPLSYQQRRRLRLSYDKNDSFGILYEGDEQDLGDCEEDEASNSGQSSGEFLVERKTNEIKARNASRIGEGHKNKHNCISRKSSSGSRKFDESEELELQKQWEILEKERRKLMEKISMADSVLSRVSAPQ